MKNRKLPGFSVRTGRGVVPIESLGELAARTGIHASTLSRLLSRKRKPTLPQLRAIAGALGITLDEALQKIEEAA
ncbi:MAG TPA: helix-turn-helix transcriptional regulator [Myxococcaceae bacterium]